MKPGGVVRKLGGINPPPLRVCGKLPGCLHGYVHVLTGYLLWLNYLYHTENEAKAIGIRSTIHNDTAASMGKEPPVKFLTTTSSSTKHSCNSHNCIMFYYSLYSILVTSAKEGGNVFKFCRCFCLCTRLLKNLWTKLSRNLTKTFTKTFTKPGPRTNQLHFGTESD